MRNIRKIPAPQGSIAPSGSSYEILRGRRSARHIDWLPKASRKPSRPSREIVPILMNPRHPLRSELPSTQTHGAAIAPRPTMSLQMRLLGCVALALVVSLALGGAIASWNASRSARAEMRGALAIGEQTVRHALDDLPRSTDPRSDLERLIAAFDGDRNLRASFLAVTGNDGGRAAGPSATSTPAAPGGTVPRWFLGLLGLAPEGVRVAVQTDDFAGIVAIDTDPSNEALEVWDGFADGLLVVALFCGQTVLLIGWFAGRAVVAPLNRLSLALNRVGTGDFAARVPGRGPRELGTLAASFNRMADQLAAAEARNRHLHAQLLTLQEEERATLARDLHDEIGPYLFAINVDAAAIARLADEQRTREIPPQVRLIQGAIGHMQAQVKATLGRLRPVGLVEFGLKQAIEQLIAFWRSRHLGTAFQASLLIDPEESGYGELIDVTLYRVVQEGVSNALRHGHPSRITITVKRDETGKQITAAIVDDGGGLSKNSEHIGFGLLGMRERVAALGGSLTITDQPVASDRGGGIAVIARLPLSV
jgi:two-component system sensor histidine kinase UhpB